MNLRVLLGLPWVVIRAGGTSQGRAWGIPWIWLAWERFMLRLRPLSPARGGALFSYRQVRHDGLDVALKDGSTVPAGALVVELHLDNKQLARMRLQPGFTTWSGVRHMREDLAALASHISAGELGPVVAIRGTSLIGRAGTTLGFDVLPVRRGWRTSLEHYFMAGIDAVYHPDGLQRLGGRAVERSPVETWMSVSRLGELYPPTNRPVRWTPRRRKR
jgi:hypothetical protein